MGGQTAPEGGGDPDSAASGRVRADTSAATPGSAALRRRSGSVPDLHGLGLYESLMSIPPLPREGAGPSTRPAPGSSVPDLYSLELECRRAQQERAELPALTRRQFLSG